MKKIFSKLMLVTALGLSTLVVSQSSQAYIGIGVGIGGGYGYYNTGYYGHHYYGRYHGYYPYYGHRYYNRYYNRCHWVNGYKVCGSGCKWVGGYWRHGAWVPKHKVCW